MFRFVSEIPGLGTWDPRALRSQDLVTIKPSRELGGWKGGEMVSWREGNYPRPTTLIHARPSTVDLIFDVVCDD